MSLAVIFGMYLLFSWPRASAVPAPAMAVWQPAQAPENQPSNTPQQDSAAQPATDQQKTPEASAPPQSPAPASSSCPETAQAGSSMKSDCKLAQPTAAKPKKHQHNAAMPGATPAKSGPTKTVVRNGGTADPTVDLSPGVSPQQASQQTKSTNQLLAASDANLKKISSRQLSANQQDTVKQIKSYMDLAKKAESDGDIQRAHNLAVKASLLSADLVGPEK